MKRAISRFVMVAAIAALVTVGVTPVLAQITFNDFSSTTGLTLNGNAAQSGNVLRLTPATTFQRGSAWFTTPQPVKGGFSTHFTFQIGGASVDSIGNADGLAFVIQTMGTGALGPDGCSMGFGGNSFCQGPGTGITNSVAVEFDTFNNGTPDLNTANHVAIQSCPGMAANSTDLTAGCTVANVSLPASLADNNVHSVAITYKPATATGCGDGMSSPCPATLAVILDNNDLFGPRAFDLSTLGLIGTNLDSAYVGFTAATGGGDDNQDILSWTFTPQAQSGVANTTTPLVLNFNGGTGNNNTGYDYNAILTNGPSALTSATVTVQPILISEEDCEKLVDANPAFGHAQCFVFQNADGKGTRSAVLYELTCPDLTGASCDQPNFFADLGADYVFQKADNPGFQFLNSTIGPYAGWLKGDGGVPEHPCRVDPNNPNTPLFHSNQISSFSVTGDPTGITKGKGRPGGSCWVATYGTSGERPPGITITSPTFTIYNRNSTVKASYTCRTPKTSKDPSSSNIGPYLTAASCTQSQAPNNNNTPATCSAPTFAGGISCSNGGVDTSVKGFHVFQVKAVDTGGNVGLNFVFYFVR